MAGLRHAARGWNRILLKLPPERRRWAAVALVGWWLSPLTAWNDAFTNIPLSLGIAYAAKAIGIPFDPKIVSVGAYIFTTALGLALLWIGLGKLSLPRPGALRSGRLLWASVRILVYSALVLLTAWSIQKLVSGS